MFHIISISAHSLRVSLVIILDARKIWEMHWHFYNKWSTLGRIYWWKVVNGDIVSELIFVT